MNLTIRLLSQRRQTINSYTTGVEWVQLLNYEIKPLDAPKRLRYENLKPFPLRVSAPNGFGLSTTQSYIFQI